MQITGDLNDEYLIMSMISRHVKNLRSKVKRMLRESRLEYLNKICDNRDQNPKRFCSFFKSKAKYSNIPGKVSTKVNDNERKYADNTTDIANMFNHYFASIFTCDSHGSTDHQDRSHNVTRIDIGGRNYDCNNEFK